jgi:hypothetical protein
MKNVMGFMKDQSCNAAFCFHSRRTLQSVFRREALCKHELGRLWGTCGLFNL